MAESVTGSGLQQSRAQAAQPPEDAPAAAQAEQKQEPQVTLRVTAPPFTDAFQFEGHRVTRSGSLVPASAAEGVIKAASGVDVTVEKVED